MKTTRRAALLAVLLGLVVSATKADPERLHHMTHAQFACVDRSVRDRLADLAGQDREAADVFVDAQLASGECTLLHDQEEVYIDHVELLGLTQVHRKGNPTAYWVLNGDRVD